ncbi:MAG TPA: hypothetical protein VM925_09320 [Labilithrix sp.]|nr:hypothetical protein [Labilithrix sp.]
MAEGLSELRSPVRMVHVLEMVGFRGAASRGQRLPLPWVPAKLEAPDFIGLLAKGDSNRGSDTPDTLDYAFMRDVAELLCAVVSKEAAA